MPVEKKRPAPKHEPVLSCFVNPDRKLGPSLAVELDQSGPEPAREGNHRLQDGVHNHAHPEDGGGRLEVILHSPS